MVNVRTRQRQPRAIQAIAAAANTNTNAAAAAARREMSQQFLERQAVVGVGVECLEERLHSVPAAVLLPDPTRKVEQVTYVLVLAQRDDQLPPVDRAIAVLVNTVKYFPEPRLQPAAAAAVAAVLADIPRLLRLCADGGVKLRQQGRHPASHTTGLAATVVVSFPWRAARAYVAPAVQKLLEPLLEVDHRPLQLLLVLDLERGHLPPRVLRLHLPARRICPPALDQLPASTKPFSPFSAETSRFPSKTNTH